MSAPTPARSEMVEKIRDLIDNDRSNPREYIAAVLDNLPREVMKEGMIKQLVELGMSETEWNDLSDLLDAAISAVRQSVLGHE